MLGPTPFVRQRLRPSALCATPGAVYLVVAEWYICTLSSTAVHAFQGSCCNACVCDRMHVYLAHIPRALLCIFMEV